MDRLKIALTLVCASVLTASALAVAPAQADPPDPCDNNKIDWGIGDTDPDGNGSTEAFIWGTWYNCGGTGSDRVRIDVKGAADGPCITVGAGQKGSRSFTREGIFPAYRGWVRC
jgi:hypothetical protein